MSGDEYLNELDIWNHPRIVNRNETESYDIAELLESYHQKEMERKLVAVSEKIKEIENDRKYLLEDYKKSNNDTERGIIAERNTGCLEQKKLLEWLSNHLKEEKP